MTPTETAMLVRYIKALCPQQRFDEYTPDAWHDLLRNLEFETARNAVLAVLWRQPFVSPSEIIAEARRKNTAKPYDRTAAEAIAASSLRELPAATRTDPPPGFTEAKRALTETLRLKAEQAMAVDRATERRARGWIGQKLSGKLPATPPGLDAPVAPRWIPLPGDPPELREWLARQARSENQDEIVGSNS